LCLGSVSPTATTPEYSAIPTVVPALDLSIGTPDTSLTDQSTYS
jgi:hypothetical protein